MTFDDDYLDLYSHPSHFMLMMAHVDGIHGDGEEWNLFW